MSTLLNDNDVALQAAPYRDKSTLVTVVTSATNFITKKNGGPTTPSSITLTATPNIVFTQAATYTWSYALNTAPTTWKVFGGNLVQGTTTFTPAGTSIASPGVYTNLVPLSTSGSGTGAKFTVTKTGSGTTYLGNIAVTVVNSGTGYQVGDTIVISGGFLGGTVGTNNLTLTVAGSVGSDTGTSTKTISADTIQSIVGTTSATSVQFRCAVSENFLDTAYGYAVVAYSLEQANSDSASIELTRSSATINSSVAGNPISFDNTGTTISVIRANTYLLYNSSGGSLVASSTPNSFSVEIVTDTTIDSTVPNRTLGTTVNTTTTWSLSGITGLTANFATVTFLVTIYDASGYKSQSVYKTLNLTKVASGVNGDPAIVYFIDVNAPVISKTTNSKYESGVHSQITVYGKKTVGTGTYTTYGYLTITGDAETESATATAATDAGLTTTIQNTAQSSSYTIKLYNMAARTDQAAVLLDTQVIPVVFNGSNGITATITNDATTVPVTLAGVPITSAYANTGTVVRVYEGANELTYDTQGTTRGTYTVTATSNNITPGTISKVTGSVYATVAIASQINADTANITYTITGTSKGGQTFTISKLQTVNKSYPGTDAQLFFLQLSAPVISKDSASVSVDGAHTPITILGRQTIGNSLPTTTGFITFTPTLLVLSTSGYDITLSGVSTLTVNTPIVFSGIGPAGLGIGTTYYIKTINTTTRVITISATVGGVAIAISTGTFTTFYAESEAVTATANGITPTSVPVDAGAYKFTVRMYSTANKTTLLDSATVAILFKGSNSITVALSNDSAVIPCDSLAAPISGAYTGTTTDIRVYDGTTELTYDGVGTTNGTYTVSAVGTSITPGAISVSGIKAAVSQASAVTNTLSSITFTVTGKSTNGSAISLTKVQSFSKTINGANGNNGLTYKIATVTAFGWSDSATAPTLTGTFNYNWSTGAITAGTGMASAYPTGYSETAGSSTANKQTLHQVMVTVTDLSTATTTNNVAWNTGKAVKIGYREDGSIGPVGDSARIAYIVTTSSTPPATPTAGAGDTVPTSSAGTWSYNATSTLTNGQFMYQSDGTYNKATNTITWRPPYLSNLKVGNLSAISADLGSITAGAINIGPDKFVVDSNGNVKIKGSGTGRMEITNEAVKVFDSTGALRVQLGNLDV